MRNPQFSMNPQFRMEVVAPQKENEDEGLLVVGLMQKDDRMKRIETGIDLNYIGYCIFDVCIHLLKLLTNYWHFKVIKEYRRLVTETGGGSTIVNFYKMEWGTSADVFDSSKLINLNTITYDYTGTSYALLFDYCCTFTHKQIRVLKSHATSSRRSRSRDEKKQSSDGSRVKSREYTIAEQRPEQMKDESKAQAETRRVSKHGSKRLRENTCGALCYIERGQRLPCCTWRVISTSTPTGAVRSVHLAHLAPLTRAAYCIRRACVTIPPTRVYGYVRQEQKNGVEGINLV